MFSLLKIWIQTKEGNSPTSERKKTYIDTTDSLENTKAAGYAARRRFSLSFIDPVKESSQLLAVIDRQTDWLNQLQL